MTEGVKLPPGAAAPVTPPAQGVKPEDEQKTVPLQALKEERDKRQALQSEVENLKVFTQQLQQHVQQAPQAPQQYGYQPQQYAAQPQPQNHPLDQLWESSPKRAVQAEIMAAMSWYDKVNAGVDQQENQTAQKFTDFSQYREPIRAYLRTIPMQQRTVPGVVEAAYYFVKGQNVDKLVQAGQADVLEKIRRGEAVQGFETGAPITPQVPVNQPNEEQKRVASAMGLSVEDYMKNVR